MNWMRWKRVKEAETRREAGFSLMELVIVLSILSTIIAVVTSGIIQIEQKSASDVNKVGMAQESRQFMDQILRDIRQSGYPSLNMFDPSTLNANPSAPPAVVCTNNNNVACGLLSFSSSAIQFEGDIDGSGVSEVYIQVVVPSGGNCPCTVQRGTVLKSVGGTPDYYTELENVMSQSVFTAYKYDGSAYNSSTDSLSDIKNIGVTLYVRSQQPDTNETSTVYPTTTMVSEVRINN
jgi:prepilin-type N-terminal cleavage/methylation domain-containing protein